MLPKRPERADAVPQTSLADVVVLVLILLVICTVFAVDEGLVLEPPKAEAGVTRVARKGTMTIVALSDGRIQIDGRPATLASVRPAAEAVLAADDRTVIVVETDPQSQYGLVVSILDDLKLARASRISLKERGK